MEEPGRGGVLADREIEPAVSVVIRIRGTTLLAVDNQAGALPRDGLEPSFAISKHQQATAGIEAWRIDLGREEILREEDVFISVAIEIGYARRTPGPVVPRREGGVPRSDRRDSETPCDPTSSRRGVQLRERPAPAPHRRRHRHTPRTSAVACWRPEMLA